MARSVVAPVTPGCANRPVVLFSSPMSKGDQTRQEIVERALALSGEVGLEGLSLGVLAAGIRSNTHDLPSSVNVVAVCGPAGLIYLAITYTVGVPESRALLGRLPTALGRASARR